jgi:arginyl-tRNA synthetase
MEMSRRIEAVVQATLRECIAKGDLELSEVPSTIPVEKPKSDDHGDFATSLCLQLAKVAHKPPRDIAKAFLIHLVDEENILESCDVAGPGFINFKVRPEVWRQELKEIAKAGDSFGRSNEGGGARVLVEFVSANPTGPLHVGHGRGAVTGDAIAALLSATGYEVEREYYINDVGNQMNILGSSLYLRYREICGRTVDFPENHYKGDYIIDFARAFRDEHGDGLVDQDYDAEPEPFRSFIKDRILAVIKSDVEALGIRFDNWFSEQTLHTSGAIDRALEALRQRGAIRTDEEERQWFKSTEYGDEEDRVVVRDNGVSTYFAADIAYHDEKLRRGYDLCINIWGSDHHGYIPRVKASLEALGHDPDKLEIVLYQFVSLVEDGTPLRMSTRAGQFETLADLLSDVGAEATRFNFLMRKSDAQFEFDLALAKSQSMDNPVYYVQYGHARMCQIIAKGAEAGHSIPSVDEVNLEPLVLPEELTLIRRALEYPAILRSAARNRSPHHIIFYLQELIGNFHTYYTKYKHSEKVVSEDFSKTQARLFLCDCLRMVIANALVLLEVSAPERMYFSE